MRKLIFILSLLIFSGTVEFMIAQSQLTQDPPNILFIAVDDLRPETGCYGSPHMKTPNIDRLAGEGLLFRRAYCQQAICMASRASIMSGIRPEYEKIYNCSALVDLAPGILTLNECFAAQGYNTYSIGKIYHYASDRADQFGKNWSDPSEQWVGRGYISDEAIAEMAANEKFNKGKKDKGPAYEMADVPDNYYLDGVNAEHAVAKLKEFRKSDKPFFLGIGFHKPHLPWCAPKKYWDLYPPEEIELSPAPDFPEGRNPYSLTNWGELRGYFGIPQGDDEVPDELAIQLRRAYFASVSYTDAQIGMVLDALEKYGLKENTIVILWGDHGWKLGDHNAWSKHTNFEFDTRVPLIISVPKMKSAGMSTRSFAEFVDIYPTLCDLAGIPKPSHLQGQSLQPVLNDPNLEIKEYACSIFPRYRDNDDKTITGFSIRTNRYRYVEWIHLQSGRTMATELYDHDADPLENFNIAGDVKYFKIIYQLSGILHRQYDDAIPGIQQKPEVFIYDPADLVYARDLYRDGVQPYTIAVDSLKASADRLLDMKPVSVMQKMHTPPGGNKHDYYSIGIYWWPNPDTKDGLPYIRKDGYRNPEYNEFDGPQMHRMSESVLTLSLAWFYTGYDPYAEKAIELLDTWFLDPDTRMNPHLEFGQAIPGITEGRGIGIIETDNLIEVVNGLGLLKGSDALTENTHRQLKAWFSEYTNWLLTSQNGWDERMWHNNHGSSYDCQVSTFALFSGLDSVATMILDSVKLKRIARQIEPDGSQPWELERTKAMSYSIMNVNLLMKNALLAGMLGIDLWNYEYEPGRSILQAIKYLVPFFTEGKQFTYQQIGGIEHYVDSFLNLLWIAVQHYSDDYLDEAFKNYPCSMPDYSLMRLTYPIFYEDNNVTSE